MPIVGWACPVCNHQVALDHYEKTKCGVSIHPDYAAAILHANDDRYTASSLTVTSALGCPRSRALEHAMNIYVNPLDFNALLIGSAWDRYLAASAPEDKRKVLVQGDIAGLHIVGEIDRVRTVTDGKIDYLAIEDHKHSNNFQYAYVQKEGPKKENMVQTALYAELYEQTFGVRPTHGILWYHFSGSNKRDKPPLVPQIYMLPSLEDCLAFKPFGGEYTVRELYGQMARFEAGEVKATDLPLAGESMTFGKSGVSFCDYCEVGAECRMAARGAPF